MTLLSAEEMSDILIIRSCRMSFEEFVSVTIVWPNVVSRRFVQDGTVR